jgi:rSAM/selenodomain-associated transferase 2
MMADLDMSVIVPVWRDAGELRGLLAGLPDRDGVEVIVATAGGDPAVGAVRAAHPQLRWVEAAKGRASQMNRGAKLAAGRWLLFLHADARLSPGWAAEIRRAAAAGAVGGSFRFTLDSTARAARVIERGVAWRVRWFGLPYGDQALFVRRDVFEALGGYRPLQLMEDVDFVRRLGRAGRLWHSTLPVRVSARRWERDGWWRRTTGNAVLLALYTAGIHPDRLARWYYRASDVGL